MANTGTIKSGDHKVAGTKNALPEKNWFRRFFYSGERKSQYVFFAVLCLLLYGNTLGNDYVLDDILVLRDNTLVIQGIKAIPRLLATTHMYGYLNIANDLYRPLSLVMFAIEYQFFGPNPAVGHFFNILVFVGCVCLLYRFLNAFLGPGKIFVAFFATLIFAVHPIHTEVVANIKSRDELLCFLFSMLALLRFLAYQEKGKTGQVVLAGFFLFLALLSKETAITLVGVLAVLFLVNRTGARMRSATVLGVALLSSGVFLGLRYWVLHRFHFEMANSTQEFAINALFGAPSATTRFATEIYVLGNYLKLLFVPYPLLCFYSYSSIPFVTFSDPLALMATIVNAGLLGLAVWRLLRNRKDAVAFGILFYFITLSLTTNIFFLIGSQMSERFLFLPSVGFCLAIAVFADRVGVGNESDPKGERTTRLVFLSALPVLLVFCGLTMERNLDWQTNFRLYQTDARHAPDDCRLNHFYAVALMHQAHDEPDAVEKRNLYHEAIGYLDHAISIYPEFVEAHMQLGVLYDALKMYDSAERHDKIALQMNQVNSLASNALAGIYYAQKKYTDAITMYRKTMAIDPNLKMARINMAHCFQEAGMYDSAIVYFRRVLAIDPGLVMANQCMAQSFFQLQQWDSASAYFGRVVQLKPDDADDMNNQGVVWMTAGRDSLAINVFETLVHRFQSYARAYSNLGVLYQRNGDYRKSNFYFLRQLQINPRDRSNVAAIASNYTRLGLKDSARMFQPVEIK